MKATLNQIAENLAKVFTDKAESAQYYSDNEQYICLCGWCGTMSPVSRPAYVKTFGKATTEEAETIARRAWDKRSYTKPTTLDPTDPTDPTDPAPSKHTEEEHTEAAPTGTAGDFADVVAADRLELLRSAAADFDLLTQAGEHIAAINARLSALFSCGVDVADLVQCADYKADKRARQRAAVVLTADEFRTLYGSGKDEQPEECGKVWQFSRGIQNGIDYELHEIRELGGVYSIVLNVCELYPDGAAFPVSFNTYEKAAATLEHFRPGVRMSAEPAA